MLSSTVGLSLSKCSGECCSNICKFTQTLGHEKLILHVMASTNFTLSTSICGFWVNYTSWWVHYKLNLLSSINESIPLIYIQRCVQLEWYPIFFVFPLWMHTSIWCLQVRKHRGVREVPTGLFQALELKDVERWTFEVLIPKLPTIFFKLWEGYTFSLK